jgi:hypothetical protein
MELRRMGRQKEQPYPNGSKRMMNPDTTIKDRKKVFDHENQERNPN